MAPNPYISSRPSDSGLHAALHPLALLSISDYITKHTLRGLTQPIVGALIGEQAGREITIEHAYDLQLLPPDSASNLTSSWQLHDEFFKTRLASYKEVLSKPPLDLVGWWTVSPPSGPSAKVMALHDHVLQSYNEGALLLAFHPDSVSQNKGGSATGAAPGVRLPLTIYESVYESSKAGAGNSSSAEDAAADESAMDAEPDAAAQQEKLEVKLRELPYEVATGEAEMISVDYVARGGGSAAVTEDPSGKGKAAVKASTKPGSGETAQTNGATVTADLEAKKGGTQTLTSEEEELVSFLTSRANAIRMLQSRIASLSSRIHSAPPSYLTSAATPVAPTANPADPAAPPHQLLRAALALVAKLSLVSAAGQGGAEGEVEGEAGEVAGEAATQATADAQARDLHSAISALSALSAEQSAAQADAAIVGLLASLGRRAQEAKELGARFAMREGGKRQRGFGGDGMAMGMEDELADIQLLAAVGGGEGAMEF